MCACINACLHAAVLQYSVGAVLTFGRAKSGKNIKVNKAISAVAVGAAGTAYSALCAANMTPSYWICILGKMHVVNGKQ